MKEVALKELGCSTAKGYYPFLLALAHHLQPLVFDVKVLELKANKL